MSSTESTITGMDNTPQKRRFKPSTLVRHGILIVMTALAIAPVLFMVITSVKTKEEYTFDKIGLPDEITFEHFDEALVDNPFLLWMRNSALLAVGSVALSTVIAALAAFAIAKMQFVGRDVLLAISTSLMVIPPVVLVVPLFVLYVQLDLISTFHGTILIYAGLITPFSVYLLVSFFRTIPTEIIEAALMDGATAPGVLWRIVLPLSGAPLVTLFIVNALYVWNDLLIALLFLQRDSSRTLMAGLSVFQGRYNDEIPLTMAGMIMASIPMLVLYIIFQRFFIRGLTAGALKG